MMNIFDITELEECVKGIVRRLNVSKTVYNDRPKAVEGTHDDFVVVKVSGKMNDIAAYGKCVVAIDLFAKDSGHLKNAKKLSVMQNRLLSGMPAAEGRYEFSINPVVLGDAPDDFGYHARMLNFETIIKVQ